MTENTFKLAIFNTTLTIMIGIAITSLWIQSHSAVEVATQVDLPSIPSISNVFNEYDTDHNGLLSHAEINTLSSTDFALLDANNDGYISKAELSQSVHITAMNA